MADERRLCEGKATKGRVCRAQALPGSHLCAHHAPNLSPEQRQRILSPRWANVARVHESGELDRLRQSLGLDE